VRDNEGAIGQRKDGRPQLTPKRTRVVLGVGQCRPADPKAKSLVEQANGYLKTSFMPGRAFSGPNDCNAQLEDWLGHRANTRHHRRIECHPAGRVVTDLAAMVYCRRSLRRWAGRPQHGWPVTTTRLPSEAIFKAFRNR
jgi:hypothetical protein